mgnify:CR=1 FL=1
MIVRLAEAGGRAVERNITLPILAEAKVTISLPADARLLFNGQISDTDGASRSFRTPPLAKGYPYIYELTAVVVRDHQVIKATERVIVWAGEEWKVTFAKVGGASG